MSNIVNIINDLSNKVKHLSECRQAAASLRKEIPVMESLGLKNIDQEKVSLSDKLEELKNAAIRELAKVVAYVNLAKEKANEEAPQLLREEWIIQKKAISELRNLLDGLGLDKESNPTRLITLPWSNCLWIPSENPSSYRSQISGLAPAILRVGEIQQIGALAVDQLQGASLPALLPIRALSANSDIKMPGHIAIFSNDADSRQAAVAVLESIALRSICTFPARKLQGIFIDPVSMGNSFPFKSLPEFIRGQQTYTRSDDVQEQLRKLTIHIEQVIQNYLSRYYQTIEEYNSAASAIEEAYRYLFTADFPTNFDNKSYEDLKSILVNGSKAGVYVVIHIDETLEKPRNFNYSIFEDNCTVLRSTGEKYQGKPLFATKISNSLTCQIILDLPPENEHFNQLTTAITEAAKSIKKDTVQFDKLYPEDLWSYDSRKEIRAPIGVTGARDRIEFWLGQNDDGLEVSQALLAGKPGAGKSYTLHAIIASLAMKYHPDELELYLLDFKEGVEFQVYLDPDRTENSDPNEAISESKALPHAKVISIESDREFGLSVLQKVQREIEARASKFKDAGGNINNLKDYRELTGKKVPRILVVIDEFQYLFREDDNITKQLNEIFEDITKRGRAFGIHLLIASQSPNVTNIKRSIYDFIDLRMAMQMNQNTAASVLGEGNTDVVDLLDRPGKIIYNKDFGRKGSNDIGQIANVTSDERQKALKFIQATATQRAYRRPDDDPLILFNGTRSTKLGNNSQLVSLSKMENWLSLSALNKQVVKEPDWSPQEFPGVAWLGEAMRIGNHTQAIFRRRPRSNMLLVGSSEETVFGILGGILNSLVHSYQPRKAEFQILDLSQPSEEDDENYWAKMNIHFRDTFSTFYPITVGKRFPDSENQIVRAESILQSVYTEFEQRKKKRDTDPDDLNLGASLFFVCAIGGLSRALNLRPIIGKRDKEMSEDAKKLMAIVSQGSELGIHIILWLDSTKSFLDLFGDSRSALTHFDLRVGLAMMPEDEARTLLGEKIPIQGVSPQARRIRACYHDEATATKPENFKGYAVPSLQEMTEYSQRFEQRTTTSEV